MIVQVVVGNVGKQTAGKFQSGNAALVNGVAGLLFLFVAPVAWEAAVLIAIGSIIGGQLGARVGRRLSPALLRGVIIMVGTFVALRLALG